jgi:lipoprotein-anchoring transpeptidase ErfK/SrfK
MAMPPRAASAPSLVLLILLTACTSAADSTRATLAPDTAASDFVAAAPAPNQIGAPAQPLRRTQPTDLPVAAANGGKRIVYSVSGQRVWLVDANNHVASTYPVSGDPTQPAPGTYHVYSRARWTVSSVGEGHMQFMVRFTRGKKTGAPIGFHDIPQLRSGSYVQSERQLGQPLSAGCIRQAHKDAAALWTFAPVGTTVVVTT